MMAIQNDYDRGPSPWFMCPRCMKQSNYHKYQETGVCPHCGNNHKERLAKKYETQKKRRDEKYRLKLEKKKNRKPYKPSKNDVEFCRHIIKGVLKAGEDDFVSWLAFQRLYSWSDNPLGDLDNEPVSKIHRAVRAGVHLGWLAASWQGTGPTPFAGSARRMRLYEITGSGKTAIQKLDNSKDGEN